MVLYAQSIKAPLTWRHGSADTETIDSAYLQICYALNAVDINNPDTYDDMQYLEIGDSTYKYYSYFIYRSDSLSKEWHKEHKGARTAPRVLGNGGKVEWLQYKCSEYFTYKNKQQFVEYANMPQYMTKYNCSCSEKLPFQLWKIENDTMTVASHLCYKATCRFRGREYVAWFTPEIPSNAGPWKFNGLPGLILKVEDSTKEYTFECIGIKSFSQKKPILIYSIYKNYPTMDKQKLLKLQQKINTNWFKAAGLQITGGNATIIDNDFNALELE